MTAFQWLMLGLCLWVLFVFILVALFGQGSDDDDDREVR